MGNCDGQRSRSLEQGDHQHVRLAPQVAHRAIHPFVEPARNLPSGAFVPGCDRSRQLEIPMADLAV